MITEKDIKEAIALIKAEKPDFVPTAIYVRSLKVFAPDVVILDCESKEQKVKP